MPPLYDYDCEKCDKVYEIYKSIHDYDGKDPCPDCGNVGNRIPQAPMAFIGTSVEDSEWNPGLGAITKGKKHREELAKRLNVVEIGNEKPQTIHKYFDKSREEKRKKAYDDV